MWNLIHIEALWAFLLPAALTIYFLLTKRAPKEKSFKFSATDEWLKKESRRMKWIYRLFFALSIIGFTALILAIARPVRLKTWVKKWSEGIDIAIVFDLSESMDADDFAPSRLHVAKSVVQDFVRNRTEDRIGLVVFAGEAVMKSPLTRDFDFLLNQVEELKMRELKQGTAIGSGLANGIARLRKSESKNKVIILLTDGDSNVGSINPITAAHLARQEGIRVYTVGIGRADRVIITIYAYDGQGRKTQPIAKIPSYLNPELLKQVATITGGRSYMARDAGMLNRILQDIDQLEKTKVNFAPLSEREELFLIPALIGTILLGLLFLLQETRFQRLPKRNVSTI
jgi:Ca-activated chloride channel homolog